MNGRFQSPDPLASSATTADPQSWNRYAYVGNNPTTSVDPSGMVGVRVPQGGDLINRGFDMKEAGVYGGIENAKGTSTLDDLWIDMQERALQAEINQSLSAIVEAFQSRDITITGAILEAGGHSIKAVIEGKQVVFELTNQKQVESIFGGERFTIKLTLSIPKDTASLTPTDKETVDEGNDVFTGKPIYEDRTTGSQVNLPENSNFTDSAKPELREKGSKSVEQSGLGLVTFSNVSPSLQRATATFSLRSRSDDTKRINAFNVTIEGQNSKEKTLRGIVYIVIRPPKPPAN